MLQNPFTIDTKCAYLFYKSIKTMAPRPRSAQTLDDRRSRGTRYHQQILCELPGPPVRRSKSQRRHVQKVWAEPPRCSICTNLPVRDTDHFLRCDPRRRLNDLQLPVYARQIQRKARGTIPGVPTSSKLRLQLHLWRLCCSIGVCKSSRRPSWFSTREPISMKRGPLSSRALQ